MPSSEFISATIRSPSYAPLASPVRIPTVDVEDTLSLVLVPEPGLGVLSVPTRTNSSAHLGNGVSLGEEEYKDVEIVGRWIGVEAIGQYNKRLE